MNASVSYSSSADSTVFSARCVALCFIHFSHKFDERSQARPHHWADLEPVSLPWGLVHLAPQTKLPAPQIEIWNTINQWSFCQFSECQAPLHKRKAPSVKTFWTVHWNIYQSIQSYIKQTVSLLGFNTAQSWKSSLRPGCGKWSGQHNAAISVVSSTTSPTWALVDIRNNAITQMFWNEQNKLGYRHMTVMVEVAKPVIMAIAVHQSLQGS